MITQKTSNVPLEEFQESIRDWYAEMSQQFISANYRSFVEEQEKQHRFELELERLDLNSEEESKRNQMKVSQRLKQYLLQKEAKDVVPKNLSVLTLPSIANAGQKHKQAVPQPELVQKNSAPALTFVESSWKRFEPTSELHPDNLFLPAMEEACYEPQVVITESGSKKAYDVRRSTTCFGNRETTLLEAASHASALQEKPSGNQKAAVKEPAVTKVPANDQKGLGDAASMVFGSIGKSQPIKPPKLGLFGAPIGKPTTTLTAVVPEVKHPSPVVFPNTSSDSFQASTPATSKGDKKPEFSFDAANAGHVTSPIAVSKVGEEARIGKPAFDGVPFDFKKDRKSDAESSPSCSQSQLSFRFSKDALAPSQSPSQSPVTFQFNKGASLSQSPSQSPITFQFNKGASPPSTARPGEKSDFVFQPNKYVPTTSANLSAGVISKTGLFSFSPATAASSSAAASISLFSAASSSSALSTSTNLFSFAPKICSPEIVKRPDVPAGSPFQSVVTSKPPVADFNEDQEILDPGFLDGCKLAKWIQFYTTFHGQIAAEISSFEKDANLKKIRISLKKFVIDKINFAAKKQASDQDLGKVYLFFSQLFEFKAVKDSDGEDLMLDERNSGMISFVMSTICYRFIDKVKWDVDLTKPLTIVIVALCVKSVDFYKVFCAEILQFSCMFPMSLSRILDKIFSFRDAAPEAATHWLSTESAIFGLFFRVQFQLTSESYLKESSAQNVKGPELIKMLLVNVLELERPVLLSSAFIVAEIFDKCVGQLRKSSKNFLAEIKKIHVPLAKRIIDFKWEPVLEAICNKTTDEKLKAVVVTRHESLLCVLKNATEKFESLPSPVSL